MSTLFLVELVPSSADAASASALIDAVGAKAELIEAQITADHSRVFTILEAESGDDVASALAGLGTTVTDPAPVRLVGAELADVKAARPDGGYLVEWDIPSHIDMDTYLTRKAEKTPLYAEVPEVSFLRTYVREDMAKCLCFYDAPDTAAVVRAREVVATPVDRLHALKQWRS